MEYPLVILVAAAYHIPLVFEFLQKMLANYKGVLETFIGPTKIFVSGETLQVKDYSKFNWTFFDGPQRVERREKVFPKELKEAYDLGASLLN